MKLASCLSVDMVGQAIGNQRIGRQRGEGGMGVVYEAVRDDIAGRAAIKVLKPEYARNADVAGRFFNERSGPILRRRIIGSQRLGNGSGKPFPAF